MRDERVEHPWAVRFSHWLIALAMAVLVPSGLEIFAAFPSFGDKIPQHDLFVPPAITRLGGWLGGAVQWHITFAWLLIGAGLLYAVYQVASGNARQVLFGPRDVPGVWPMIRHYFFFGPKPPQAAIYNPLQKLAYTSAIGLTVLAIVSGLALYKPVQLGWLVARIPLRAGPALSRHVRPARVHPRPPRDGRAPWLEQLRCDVDRVAPRLIAATICRITSPAGDRIR
jgi:thiosulfate reductase cytochrome b subunit